MDVKNLVTGVLWTGVVLPGVAYPLASGWSIWLCDAVFTFSVTALVYGVWFHGRYWRWCFTALVSMLVCWEVFQWNLEKPEGLTGGIRLLVGHAFGVVSGLLGAAAAYAAVKLFVRTPPMESIEVSDEEEV